MTGRPLVLFVAAGALAVGAVARPARAADTTACVGAASRGQQLRSNASLRAAREQFLLCADPTCPRVVRSDCTRWVAEVEASMPTVVVMATAADADVTNVAVSLDGEPLLTSLDGKAVPVDPGPHTFRATHADRTVEQRIVVAEGDKNRKVVLRFTAESGAAAPPFTAPTRGVRSQASPEPPATTTERARAPVVPIVLAGVGIVALGSFTYFGLTGKSDYRSLQRDCSPGCSDQQIAKVHDKLLVADVSVGVAIVSLAAAAVVFLATRAPSRSAPAQSAHVR